MSIPFITSLDPTEGTADGGVFVVISGEGLLDVTSVTFGGIDAASFSVDSDTQLSAETPSGLFEGDNDVVLSNDEGSSDPLTFTVVSQEPPPAEGPTIDSVDPSTVGPEGGFVVTIFGSGLVDVGAVTFDGGDAASFSVDSDTQVSAETPPFVVSGDITIEVSTAVGSATATLTVTESPAAPGPVIDNIDPASIDPAGGGTFTITGSNFVDVQRVTIGGTDAASFSVDSDSRISVEVPPLGQEGDLEVTVTTSAGSATVVVTVGAAGGCTVSAFNVPTGRSGCTKVGSKVGEKFRMEADFTATCACCEYRQLVRGTFIANGRTVRHLLPDPAGGPARPMLPRPAPGSPDDNFREDGVASPPAGINKFYGHRNEGNTDPNDLYKPDRATGCQYRGADFPGLNGPSGTTYSIELDFRGQIIDVCKSDAVKKTNDWTVSCAGTI